ncbi:MAG: type II toxin-antitoxin system HicA family toxin [Planctomycetes bacterium]|nr:type II toxin-antitoxin system HicA family toxin [Planctomycetota bacterium]
MSKKLPALTGREIISALEKIGFESVRRSKGSHVQLAHDDGRRVTVPDHGSTPIGKGLLRKILRD